jgi:hypothetical protein
LNLVKSQTFETVETPAKAAEPDPKTRPHPITLLPTEILQHIFAQLGLHSLLHRQSFCHHWNACIPGSSAAIHAAMFLPSPTQPMTESVKLRFKVNIWALFPDVCMDPILSYTLAMSSVETQRLQDKYVIRMHPYFTPWVYGDRVSMYTNDCKWSESGDWWMKSLVCWPPARHVEMEFEYEDDLPDDVMPEWYIDYDIHATEGEMSREEGVRLGALMGEVKRLVNLGWR